MNHKDKALRIAYVAFISHYRHSLAGKRMIFTADEYKTLADLCALALPMKYRFTSTELKAMKHPNFVDPGGVILKEWQDTR